MMQVNTQLQNLNIANESMNKLNNFDSNNSNGN